jgi:protein-disulfide isomerase
MNTKRFIYWGSFIVILGLIIWGMVAAANKASREEGYIPLPDQILATDWSKGNPIASVNIVEYSDFQCPACAAYFPLIEKVVSENINNIRFVYRHFPLSQHANAIPAAKAAEASGKQGKFWEMYKKIFENHDNWENSLDVKTIFNGYAEELGLDMNKYLVDFDSKEVMDKINIDMKSGLKAGINSTPTFYINGKKIKNPQNYEDFKKLIDEASNTTTKS